MWARNVRHAFLKLLYHISIIFSPGIPANERYERFEEPLNAMLREENLGWVIGGGGSVDGSDCDVSVALVDLVLGLRILRRVLREQAVPSNTRLELTVPEKRYLSLEEIQ